MLGAGRIAAYLMIFGATSMCWLVLGNTMTHRTSTQSSKGDGEVGQLWGGAHRQAAPGFTFRWTTPREVVEHQTQGKRDIVITRVVQDTHERTSMPASTDVNVGLELDERLRGLVWYALYNVAFDGTWSYVHREPYEGVLAVGFAFPDPDGIYDGFKLEVNGVDHSQALRPMDGKVETQLQVKPGEKVVVHVTYKTRGRDTWSYAPTTGVDTLEKFKLTMHTNFNAVDFPTWSLSPTHKAAEGKGMAMTWEFERAVTGRGMGMVMPTRIQPGELAATLAFSAPISLFFFLLLMWVLAVLRGLDLHPINALFLSGAFFAFHLLFGYSVDHLALPLAFGLSAVVSMLLVVSYMRLVVGPKFALVQAGAAQLVYLVGFSLAHFFEGFTGLTVTVLAVLTLFLLMQLTGRIKWGALEGGDTSSTRQDPPQPSPAHPDGPVTSAAPLSGVQPA